ncbi:MAG: methyltransferase domain-containing protein [Saccharopolyspora sp.]|uniref:class I SAM-dependent methyltransferase n=1 Tax=Saccharopolyspora sp. TaxID=33915 RepID=UPI0025D1400F|nr:methyltransferase domain-containing protein [Saccharopolyspora sp.]MBQ6640280.1 methyltransferase domain-containing protein [Saccharopolyspora sp.]
MSSTALPDALNRALPLLAEAPDSPEAPDGYLDLLGEDQGSPQEEKAAIWSSQAVSALYDYGQSLVRTVATTLPASATRLPEGTRVLDVGCGPGNITGKLGRVVGPDGLALGVDISAAMLERAVQAEDAPQVGFLRADACRLPFHDGSFDAVTSIAAVHNTPEPLTALSELARVLAPGARLTVLVLATGGLFDQGASLIEHLTSRFPRPNAVRPEQVAEVLHASGVATVHTHRNGSLLWVDALKQQ